MSKIKEILTFSKSKSSAEVFEQAELIATQLIKYCALKSFDRIHHFNALEFYINIPGVFEDGVNSGGPTHMRDEQLQSGTFYCHTKSNNGKWSAPIFNRHGIDITAGDFSNNIHCGILIRHLGANDPKVKHMDGSGRALRVLLRGDSGFKAMNKTMPDWNWSKSELAYLEELNGSSICEGKTQIIELSNPRNVIIEAKPRIGIDGKKNEHAPLRFVVKE
ncbi:MAG: hypothetical protein OHK0056_31160 [Bacteriovoracaceae bacterium]